MVKYETKIARAKSDNEFKKLDDYIYEEIGSLVFTPATLYKKFEKKVKRGQRYRIKLFGVIPLWKKTAKEDLYLNVIDEYDTLENIKWYCELPLPKVRGFLLHRGGLQHH